MRHQFRISDGTVFSDESHVFNLGSHVIERDDLEFWSAPAPSDWMPPTGFWSATATAARVTATPLWSLPSA